LRKFRLFMAKGIRLQGWMVTLVHGAIKPQAPTTARKGRSPVAQSLGACHFGPRAGFTMNRIPSILAGVDASPDHFSHRDGQT
jgi:hypothetical protein